MAMGLDANDCVRSTNWRISDSEVIDYLRGKSSPSLGENGWILSTVDGYALGWGKRVGNILKNHYPHGLRWN
jgi:NOL1/NOP2/fmu family ribosome biogenesis protein